jgi:hypothetical protein
MRKLITLFGCFFTLCAYAQGTDEYYNPEKPKLFSKERISTSISAGTGVMFGNNATGFTTFVAPKINYQLSNKFRLNVGFMHYTASANTAFLLNPNEAIVNRSQKNVSGNLVMIGGDYMLSKKLILSGSVMKDNLKAASLGLEYKMSNHSSIKIETTISNGQGNYYQNPFPSSSMSGGMFDSGFPR